jgi:hypothetical protein
MLFTISVVHLSCRPPLVDSHLAISAVLPARIIALLSVSLPNWTVPADCATPTPTYIGVGLPLDVELCPGEGSIIGRVFAIHGACRIQYASAVAVTV